MYAGDAHLELSTSVQANPLAKPASAGAGLFATPAAERGMLFAASPLTVPMRVRLSEVHLRAIVVLVVSRTKGITLVFKNDPLESVKVSSTFDSVGVIQKYLQEEIEAQLREMFREDLPTIIHRLSQEWLRTDPAPRQAPSTPAAKPRPEPEWPVPPPEEPLAFLSLDDAAPRASPAAVRLAHLASENSPHGLADLFAPPESPAARARTFHATSRVRAPQTPVGTPPRLRAEPAFGGLDMSGHLAELLKANHTLSPYTRQARHVAIRSAPGHKQGRVGRVHARQRRRFQLGGQAE